MKKRRRSRSGVKRLMCERRREDHPNRTELNGENRENRSLGRSNTIGHRIEEWISLFAPRSFSPSPLPPFLKRTHQLQKHPVTYRPSLPSVGQLLAHLHSGGSAPHIWHFGQSGNSLTARDGSSCADRSQSQITRGPQPWWRQKP